jgi:hypothetical protein
VRLRVLVQGLLVCVGDRPEVEDDLLHAASSAVESETALAANTVDTTKWMLHTFDSNFHLGATAERV